MIKRCFIGALAAALFVAFLTGCRKPNAAHRPPAASGQALSPSGEAQASSLPGYAPNMLLCSGSEDGLRAYAMAMTRTDKGEWSAPKRFITVSNGDARFTLVPSPNGKAVAFTSDEPAGPSWPVFVNDLFVYSFDTRRLHRVTQDTKNYTGVTWSNDSRFLAFSNVWFVSDAPNAPISCTLYVYDASRRRLSRVSGAVGAAEWGPVPGRLLFQKEGSSVLYEYDATKRRTLAVGRMPARFYYFFGRWAIVSRLLTRAPELQEYTLYRLHVARRGGKDNYRAVLHARFEASPLMLAGGVSPGQNRVILVGRRSALVVLDLARRTFRFCKPLAKFAYPHGWSNDGKAVLVSVSPDPDGPDRRTTNQAWLVLVDTVPEIPIGQVDWDRPSDAKAVLLKEMDANTVAQAWLGPAR